MPSTISASSASCTSNAITLPARSSSSIVSSIAGNALEFYDFVLYAYFAIYLGQTFFPVAG